MLHKYFKTNKDEPEKNYYRKITEENKWLKKLSPIKMYQTTIRNQIITKKFFADGRSLYIDHKRNLKNPQNHENF